MVDFDKQFWDFDEVRSMYVPIGDESKVEEYSYNQQQPFELIRNLAFASGDDRDLLKYPTPRIIASKKCLCWKTDLLVLCLTTAYTEPSTTVDKRPNAIRWCFGDAYAADKNAWTKDEEFARQTLAGMNPLLIETLKVQGHVPRVTIENSVKFDSRGIRVLFVEN